MVSSNICTKRLSSNLPSTITYFKTKLERKNEVLQMKKHWCYVVAVVPTEVFQNLASNSFQRYRLLPLRLMRYLMVVSKNLNQVVWKLTWLKYYKRRTRNEFCVMVLLDTRLYLNHKIDKRLPHNCAISKAVTKA